MGAIGSGGIGQVEVDGADVLWTEARPADGGRTTLVRRTPEGTVADLLPAPFDVGSRVHEYGGRAFAAADGIVWFSHRGDDRIYQLAPGGGEPRAVTAAGGPRLADFCADRARGLLFAVAEDHREPGEARNYLVTVSTMTGTIAEITGGYDFYGAPRLSPDGSRLAWVCWRHPDMPWDATELWVADVAADGTLSAASRIAGHPGESVVSPRWSPAGDLHFVSDRSGFWTLYAWSGGEPVLRGPGHQDCGGFLRILNNNGYDITSSGRVWYATNRDGLHGLARIEPGSGGLTDVPLPFTYITDVRPYGEDVVFAGASPTTGQTVVRAGADGGWQEIRPPQDGERMPADWISVPEPITFAVPGGGDAHAFLYQPVNPRTTAPDGELPPLVVNIHGGPVWAAFGCLQPEAQFFTSRGLAYLDVNYRGSIGWGRAYRHALYGQWGVADVEDAVAAALAVTGAGRADPARVAVRGPSAGGWTALAALAFTDFFAAGVSAYGVSDPERFVLPGGTHKYESRYNTKLIAPYPEGKDVYDRRSPLRSAASISSPLLLLQGVEDRVVLPEQSRLIADAVRRNGVTCELVEFPGEGHGFRQAAHIAQAYEAELAFLGRALGFEPAQARPPSPGLVSR